MKTTAISIAIGVGFFALCFGLCVLAADDWKHEMVDTDLSFFFFRLTIWSLIVLPFFASHSHWLIIAWVLTPLMNSLVVYAILFSVDLVRGRRTLTRTQQAGDRKPNTAAS
ncbi:MAG: hypothetical protein MI807_03635 [Verrucomicrobiales bacterium]|nr:hypothetical protein [Verrucomicrobiales bacterium]